ncbi:MAG: Uncharacterised protein [Gammaproteobacteria bacterium]|nr:MAG: Uncharacterised protein [Gammaproteobacteria bacterium]
MNLEIKWRVAAVVRAGCFAIDPNPCAVIGCLEDDAANLTCLVGINLDLRAIPRDAFIVLLELFPAAGNIDINAACFEYSCIRAPSFAQADIFWVESEFPGAIEAKRVHVREIVLF